VVAPSFDNQHWGAALTIDSLEATQGFETINENCAEPVNGSFIEKNGVPNGPPSPQLANLASSTPNAETLLMNPGDQIRLHIFNPAVPGEHGAHALEAKVTDLTTGESGFIQASAANGFMNTNILDCSGTPYNFQPEYSTAKKKNLSPWGAGTEVISSSFETGHFTPCTSISGKEKIKLAPGVTDTQFNFCHGPYQDAGGPETEALEPTKAPCFPKGDEHGGLAAGFPDTTTGCLDFEDGGDIAFIGTPYYEEWPTSTTPTANPSTWQIESPTGPGTQAFTSYQFQTDLPFSELTTCVDPNHPQGCTAPSPISPGGFYPYWTQATSPKSGKCVWEFGNVTNGKTFGGVKQYGKLNPNNFPDLSSRFFPNNCTA
jgi:hypothetical protein